MPQPSLGTLKDNYSRHLNLPRINSQQEKRARAEAQTLSQTNSLTYCGGVFGVTEIGFGGSGAFGAVNPGITGFCPITPLAAP